MDIEKIKSHPVYEVYTKMKMYCEEPGDPVWDKIRKEIEIDALLIEPIVEDTIWKAMIYDVLNDAYNKDSNKFLEEGLFMIKLLIKSFEHLKEVYKNGSR